jgi:hypothetical protein
MARSQHFFSQMSCQIMSDVSWETRDVKELVKEGTTNELTNVATNSATPNSLSVPEALKRCSSCHSSFLASFLLERFATDGSSNAPSCHTRFLHGAANHLTGRCLRKDTRRRQDHSNTVRCIRNAHVILLFDHVTVAKRGIQP